MSYHARAVSSFGTRSAVEMEGKDLKQINGIIGSLIAGIIHEYTAHNVDMSS